MDGRSEFIKSNNIENRTIPFFFFCLCYLLTGILTSDIKWELEWQATWPQASCLVLKAKWSKCFACILNEKDMLATVLLRLGHSAKWQAVRKILPHGLTILEESFSHDEVQFQKVLLTCAGENQKFALLHDNETPACWPSG